MGDKRAESPRWDDPASVSRSFITALAGVRQTSLRRS